MRLTGHSNGRFTQRPKSPESHLSSIRAISTVESKEVGTYHFTRGLLSLKYDMDVYMTTLFGGEVRLGTCVES
jgi:hypothetical protein